MIAERNMSGGHFTIRRENGAFVTLLSFREVQALVAVRDGMARARKLVRRTHCFYDEYLVAECDVYGVGALTFINLQMHGLVAKPGEEGPLALTDIGAAALRAVLALDGVRTLAVAA